MPRREMSRFRAVRTETAENGVTMGNKAVFLRGNGIETGEQWGLECKETLHSLSRQPVSRLFMGGLRVV